MSLDKNEIQFLINLNDIYNKWIPSQDINDCSENNDIDIDYYNCFFRAFFEIEAEEVEELFQIRFGEDLFLFFCEHYKNTKNVIFLAFIIHFIIEENFKLFIRRFEPTGKFSGLWAIGYLKESDLSNLIVSRMQKPFAKEEGLALVYKEFYQNKLVDSINPILNGTNENENQDDDESPNQDNLSNSLLAALVGASAALVLVPSLIKWVQGKHSKVWGNLSNLQTMCCLGYATGSIKLYGFCMEEPKKPPRKGSIYYPLKKNSIRGQLFKSFDKVPDFNTFFLKFTLSTDTQYLEIAKTNQDDIWYMLQIFFWIITQPYKDYKKKIGAILFQNKNLVIDTFVTRNLIPHAIEKNDESIILMQKCLDILEENEIDVYPGNEIILQWIKGVLNWAKNNFQ